MGRFWSFSGGSAGAVLGVLLIVGGICFLVAQYVPIDLGHYGWPLFVIGPGVALVVVGVVAPDLSGLIIPGSIVTVTGLVLAVQNTFDLWATWSYAWALIFPGAFGAGTALLGAVRGSPGQVRGGMRAALAGLVMFLVFGAFFEGVAHVSGLDLGAFGQVVLPVLLIVVGVLLLAGRLVPGRPAGPPAAPPPGAAPGPGPEPPGAPTPPG